jgi:5-methylcytosine-specific restriction endonuclease McrA
MCAYCGERPAIHQDHVVPLSKGGTDDLSNLLPSCQPCNQSKGHGDPRPWLERALLVVWGRAA